MTFRRTLLSLLKFAIILGFFVAQMAWAQIQPPSNDTRAAAQELVTGRYSAVDLRSATVEPDELIPPDYTPATWSNSAWFTWTAPSAGGWHAITTSTVSLGLWKIAQTAAPEPMHSCRFYPGFDAFVFLAEPETTYLIGITSEKTAYASCAMVKVVPHEPPSWTVLQTTISPSSVDVSSTEQAVDVVFTMSKDEASSLDDFVVGLRPPASRRNISDVEPMAKSEGIARELSSTDTTRTFCQRLIIPAKAMPGPWKLEIASSNSSPAYASGTFGTTLLGGQANPSLIVMNHGDLDQSGPDLLSVSALATSCESESAESLQFSLNIAVDALVSESLVFLKNEESQEEVHFSHSYQDPELWYTNKYLSPGNYVLICQLIDRLGNRKEWRSTDPTFPGPFRGMITITGTPPSILHTLSTSTTEVDVSERAAEVRFEARITDFDAEEDTIEIDLLGTFSDTKTYSVRRLSGTTADGIYEFILNVERDCLPGTYDLRLDLETSKSSRWGVGYRPLPNSFPPITVVNRQIPICKPIEVTSFRADSHLLDLRDGTSEINIEISFTEVLYSMGLEIVSVSNPSTVAHGIIVNNDDDDPTRWHARLGGELFRYFTRNLPNGSYIFRLRGYNRTINGLWMSSEFSSLIGSTTSIELINNPKPELKSLTVEPSTIDVTNGPSTVMIRAEIDSATTPNSALLQLSPRISEESIWMERISTIGSVSTFEAEISIPQGMKPGPISARLIIHPALGNDLDKELPQLIQVSNTGSVDDAPPRLISFDISPVTVDVTEQSQTVIVTVHAEDDVGVKNIYIYDFAEIIFISLDEGDLVNGTLANGTWQKTIRLSPADEAISPSPLRVIVSDNLLHEKAHCSNDTSFPGPFHGLFSIINSTGEPTLNSLQLSADTVDISHSSQELTFFVDAVFPGEMRRINVTFSYWDEDRSFDRTISINQSESFEGSTTEGTWDGRLSLPQGLTPGIYSISVELLQTRGPWKYFGSYDDDNDIVGTLTVVNTGTLDKEPPTLLDIVGDDLPLVWTLGSAYIGSQGVRAIVEDTLSGVRSVEFRLNGEQTYRYYPEPLMVAEGESWQVSNSFIYRSGVVSFDLKLTDLAGNTREILNAFALTIEPEANPFAVWASRWGLRFDADPLADQDKDGLSNLLEYALGISPTSSEAAEQEARPPLDLYDHIFGYYEARRGIPLVSLETNGALKLQWWQPKEMAAMGLRCFPEASSDLVNWQPLSDPGTVTPNRNEYTDREWITFRDPADTNSSARPRWLRLKVELLPEAR